MSSDTSGSSPSSHSAAHRLLPLALLALLQGSFVVSKSAARFLTLLSESHGAWHVLWFVLQLTGTFAAVVLLVRLIRVVHYRPVQSVRDDELPAVTVIVPAFNEGKQVYRTLESVAASDYPRDRLQIISVDDGSADDTWEWIKRGRASFPALVNPIRFVRNRGKREALYQGFLLARGDVIVTIDSDSEVLPDTLRNLVSPMVRDPRVGAVAGNVRVLNGSGIIAKMLDVVFTYNFEFIRAAESMVGTVTCCPGALSAYRRTLVDQFREEWKEQTFLGTPATIGEDRAMTNLVLRMGSLVRFQANAVVFTEVPRRLPQLCRMLLRWERSNVRETLVLARFAFTRFRNGPMLGARFDLSWATWRLLFQSFSLPTMLVAIATRPELLGWTAGLLLLSALLPAALFATTRGLRGALWSLPYAWFSAIFLSWIIPYAMLTPHRSAWLTRGKPALPPAGLEPAPAGRLSGASLEAS